MPTTQQDLKDTFKQLSEDEYIKLMLNHREEITIGLCEKLIGKSNRIDNDLKKIRNDILLKEQKENKYNSTKFLLAFGFVREIKKKSINLCINIPTEIVNIIYCFDLPGLELLPQFVSGCFSDDQSVQHESLSNIRRLVSGDDNVDNVTREIINTGIIPRIIHFLKDDNNPRLQLQAAWILTNIAASEHENTMTVVHGGAIPILIDLIKSKSLSVSKQSLWVLSNIAGNSVKCRNMVISYDVLSHVKPRCQDFQMLSDTKAGLNVLQSIAWLLTNLCRGRSNPNSSSISEITECFKYLININDDNMHESFAWSFNFLISKTNNQFVVDQMQAKGIAKKLIDIMCNPSTDYKIRQIVVRTFYNIEFSSNMQFFIQYGVFDKLSTMLCDPKIIPQHKRDLIRVLSNMIIEDDSVVGFISKTQIVRSLIETLTQDPPANAQEAFWCLSNMILTDNEQQITYLVSLDIIPRIVLFMNRTGHKNETLMRILECLNEILETNEAYTECVKECGGLDTLQNLQYDVMELSVDVLDMVGNLLSTYWSDIDLYS